MRLVREMTYRETIAGPWGPSTGSPLGDRLCWQISAASLSGPRIDARLVMPGHDWIRLGPDGIRRQDSRVTLATGDGELILLRYDLALIRDSGTFLAALDTGGSTGYDDQYMRIAPRFDTGAAEYAWLTQSLFLGEGRLGGAREIEYDIYRVD
jgi:uncharacterized protein DUF3237